MEIDDYLKFANANQASYFATVDGDQPRVRALLMWYADLSGLYYGIDASKDVYKQLKANPKVEVCFFEPKSNKMMRVAGKVEFLNDLNLKKKLIEARPFLKQMGLTPESPGLIIFRVSKCTAHFWTRETTSEPKKCVSFG
jgi:uncharacterized pyridoxamine 5'-phosphate oxidase family protein